MVRLRGTDIPWVGSYRLDANVVGATGGVLARFAISRFQLLPTRDLVVGIDRVNAGSVNPAPAAEIQAARDAMAQIGRAHV